MDKESHEIIDWLKKQPQNAVIDWATDHMEKGRPWSSGWVDVRVPAMEKDLKMNWVWTIVEPDDPDDEMNPEAIWKFAIPHDLDIYGVYDPEPPNYWYINEFIFLKGWEPSAEQMEQLKKVEQAGPNRKVVVRGGWSVAIINFTLAEWAAKHAGRPDLKFRWDFNAPESEMLRQAIDSAKRTKEGKEKTYNLGDGIQASEQAMNFMLEDLDRAAEIMKKFKEILGK